MFYILGILSTQHSEANRVQMFARREMHGNPAKSQSMPVLPIQEMSVRWYEPWL